MTYKYYKALFQKGYITIIDNFHSGNTVEQNVTKGIESGCVLFYDVRQEIGIKLARLYRDIAIYTILSVITEENYKDENLKLAAVRAELKNEDFESNIR